MTSHSLCYYSSRPPQCHLLQEVLLHTPPPSQCDVCLLCIHRTLYVTSLGITIISLVQYLGIPLCIRSTPNNYNSQTWWSSLLNLKTKRFKAMESLAAAEGLYLGDTGDRSGKSRLGFAWNEWGVGKVLSTIISLVSGCLSLVWHIVHIMNTLGSCTK